MSNPNTIDEQNLAAIEMMDDRAAKAEKERDELLGVLHRIAEMPTAEIRPDIDHRNNWTDWAKRIAREAIEKAGK